VQGGLIKGCLAQHVIHSQGVNQTSSCNNITALQTLYHVYVDTCVNKEIKHMYPCFIAVIKYGYEFGCVWIKSRVPKICLEDTSWQYFR